MPKNVSVSTRPTVQMTAHQIWRSSEFMKEHYFFSGDIVNYFDVAWRRAAATQDSRPPARSAIVHASSAASAAGRL